MQLEEGAILEGKVTGIKNFGAFVLLPNGTTGLVHISEVANEYIEQLSDVLAEGQTVKVKVVSVSKEGKVALSMKATQDKPPMQQRQQGSQQRPPQRQQKSGGAGGIMWQPKAAQSGENMSFEDRVSRFKSQSEEKIGELKRATDTRRGSGGYSRRR